MNIRSFVISSLLIIALAPLAAADVACVGEETAACVIVSPDDRFSWFGVEAYDAGTGTIVSVGAGEGSGFFADTATGVVFAYNPTTGQWIAIVLAANDYGRDGGYDHAGVAAETWSDFGPAAGAGAYAPLP